MAITCSNNIIQHIFNIYSTCIVVQCCLYTPAKYFVSNSWNSKNMPLLQIATTQFSTTIRELRSVLKHHTSQNTSEHKWTQMNTSEHESEPEWTQVNTNEHEWTRVRIRVNTTEHEWTRVNTSQNTSDYERTRVNTTDYEWLRVKNSRTRVENLWR